MGSQVTGGRPSWPPQQPGEERPEGCEGGCVGGSTAVCVSSRAPGGRNGPEQAREGLTRWLRVDSELKRGLFASLCVYVCVCVCAHMYAYVLACVYACVCTCVCVHVCACTPTLWEQVPILLSMWDLSAKPQDPPGAKEARNLGPWALQRALE